MLTTEISIEELKKLREKAAIFDKIKLEESLQISQNITNNAINVNKASTTRLDEIKNIEQLVNNFINHSNGIQTISKSSLESSQLTSEESNETIKLIEELFELITNMSNAISEFSKTISELNEKNKSISALVSQNDKISMQTNLLAINAAIEASKAKEFGKGFAIVASEVKKLAAASKQSTLDIGSEINKISQMTILVTEKNEAVEQLIENSVETSKVAIEKLNRLICVAKENSDNSNMISSNVNQQLENSDIIKNKITNLVEDTKKAIEGSQTNIQLGQNLINTLNIR